MDLRCFNIPGTFSTCLFFVLDKLTRDAFPAFSKAPQTCLSLAFEQPCSWSSKRPTLKAHRLLTYPNVHLIWPPLQHIFWCGQLNLHFSEPTRTIFENGVCFLLSRCNNQTAGSKSWVARLVNHYHDHVICIIMIMITIMTNHYDHDAIIRQWALKIFVARLVNCDFFALLICHSEKVIIRQWALKSSVARLVKSPSVALIYII